MITAYEMTTKELTARLEALAEHQHTERLGREVNNIWRQVCREAASRLRSTEADQLDAARYRWLAKMWPLEITRLVHNHHWQGQTSSEIDEAIDAAMRQSAGEGKPSPSDKVESK